jgi:hypothetical protein
LFSLSYQVDATTSCCMYVPHALAFCFVDIFS